MRILLLHGAIKNAGDFLIKHRVEQLLKNNLNSCDIYSIWEGESLNPQRHLIDECDAIVFGGGPFFTSRIYPHDIPFVENLDEINKPMINLGGGWFGSDGSSKSIFNYTLDSSSQNLLKHIEKSAGVLSCRDWQTTNMLRKKGFKAEMHGCPAWYDMDYLSKKLELKDVKRICISDPAMLSNLEAARNLVTWTRSKYKNAEILYIFHRGMWGDDDGKQGKIREQGIKGILEKNHVKCVNIAGGCEGFSIYDTCQLHIGFRVHAHIYNMSHRNLSILIEEDGRGAGVNQALGFNSIYAYDESKQYKNQIIVKLKNKINPTNNSYIIDELECQLQRIEDTNGMEYEQAFTRMRYYYQQMQKHVRNIEKW